MAAAVRNVLEALDGRRASDPSDGVVSRAQIAQVLVASLTSAAADHKSLELVAEHGPAQAESTRELGTGCT